MLKTMSNLFKGIMIAGVIFMTPAVLVTVAPIQSAAVYAKDDPTAVTATDCLNADKTLNLTCANLVGTDVASRINSFAAVLAGVVVAIAALMIVYAGFKYATSQGDPKTTEQAKMQIIGAGIGIVVTMIAYLIVKIFTKL